MLSPGAPRHASSKEAIGSTHAALYAALMTSKERIQDATGKNRSQTIIVRRALDFYLTQLAKLNEDQLAQESHYPVRHR